MDSPRAPETVLEEIVAIATMERGRLCEIHTQTGQVYHNLQFWNEGRNRCEYVRCRDLEAVLEATENYQRYRGLTDEYAAAVERRTRQARGGPEQGAEKGGSARRQRRPPDRRSRPPSSG
jgi:TusA-related sulfurtransferase